MIKYIMQVGLSIVSSLNLVQVALAAPKGVSVIPASAVNGVPASQNLVEQSGLIKEMMADDQEGEYAEIPLSNVDQHTLELVERHLANPAEPMPESNLDLVQLLKASNYLDIASILNSALNEVHHRGYMSVAEAHPELVPSSQLGRNLLGSSNVGDLVKILYATNGERLTPVADQCRNGAVASIENPNRYKQGPFKEMFGYRLTIGHTLVDRTGRERLLKFEDAKNACLDLNLDQARSEESQHRRERVRVAFEAREEALDAIRRTNRDFSDPTETALALVHRNYPINGCYLMSREEWKQVDADRELQRQLPMLEARWFWSSSGNPAVADTAFIFSRDGSSEVDSGYRSVDKSVRCGCR